MDNISVQKRDLTLKAKKMRSLGLVPGSIFGKSLPESISIQMKESVARGLVRQKREGSKLVLDLDGVQYQVQIKEKEMNSMTNAIEQISFQVLTADEKVNSVIHILLVHDEKFGGLLEKMLMEIPYASLPADMIDTITIDADGLKTGDILFVKDIPQLMSDKIELQVPKDEMVLRIVEKKQIIEEPAEEQPAAPAPATK